MLTPQELKIVLAAAKRHFGVIRKKYPELKGYLVLSLPSGETGIDSALSEALGDFSDLAADDSAKTVALEIVSRSKKLELAAKQNSRLEGLAQQRKSLKDEMSELAPRLIYNGDAQVEIRFYELNYELVWKLQKDELIDRTLTPQSKASIRIVLGTLAHFKTLPTEQ